jgi:dCMP deaminase
MTKSTVERDIVYMKMARDISNLSKDKNTHIGCMIVASDGTPVSWGYNGAIAGCNDVLIPHSREIEPVSYRRVTNNGTETITLDLNKYPFMSHAEANAIYFADRNKLIGSTLYVTAYPCIECAKAITRAGIKRVVIETPSIVDSTSSIEEVNYKSECIMAQKNITLTVDGNDIQLYCD